jgi:hypothetical protein
MSEKAKDPAVEFYQAQKAEDDAKVQELAEQHGFDPDTDGAGAPDDSDQPAGTPDLGFDYSESEK